VKKQLILWLVLLWLHTAAASAPVFQQPATAAQIKQLIAPAAKELKRSPVVRGSFVQRKTLKDIPKPLKASGEFIIAPEQGIYWHTKQPFDSEFILTPESMVQLDGGTAAVRLSAAQQPGLRVVGDVFFSIFNLDPTALANNFKLFGLAGKGSAWVLGLSPKNPALATVLSAAVIHGNSRVEKVELWDAHGDFTEIMLTTRKAVSVSLTPAEAALFRK
jgi:hypothetical protein